MSQLPFQELQRSNELFIETDIRSRTIYKKSRLKKPFRYPKSIEDLERKNSFERLTVRVRITVAPQNLLIKDTTNLETIMIVLTKMSRIQIFS